MKFHVNIFIVMLWVSSVFSDQKTDYGEETDNWFHVVQVSGDMRNLKKFNGVIEIYKLDNGTAIILLKREAEVAVVNALLKDLNLEIVLINKGKVFLEEGVETEETVRD